MSCLGLSQRRAQAVVAALTPLTAGVHYSVAGRGEADPVAPNTKPDGSDNPAGRALNRRVTVAFAVAAPPKPPPAPRGPTATTQAGQTIHFSPPTSNGQSTYGASVLSAYRDGGLLAVALRISCVRATYGNPCAPTLELGGNAVAPPQVLSRASGASSYDPPAQSTARGFPAARAMTSGPCSPLRRRRRTASRSVAPGASARLPGVTIGSGPPAG